MSDTKLKFVNGFTARVVLSFCIEIALVSIAFVFIVALTYGVNLLLVEYLSFEPENESYLTVFTAAKWVVLGIDLIVWMLITAFFALKLVFEVARAELPPHLVRSIRGKIGQSRTWLIKRHKRLEETDKMLFLHKTQRSGEDVWSQGLYVEDSSIGGGSLMITKTNSSDQVIGDNTIEYHIETYRVESYLIVSGERSLPSSVEAPFVGVFRPTKRRFDGEEAGVIFHDKGNTNSKSFSPAIILPVSSILLHGILESGEEPEVISDPDKIQRLDELWTQQVSLGSLIPIAEGYEPGTKVTDSLGT